MFLKQIFCSSITADYTAIYTMGLFDKIFGSKENEEPKKEELIEPILEETKEEESFEELLAKYQKQKEEGTYVPVGNETFFEDNAASSNADPSGDPIVSQQNAASDSNASEPKESTKPEITTEVSPQADDELIKEDKSTDQNADLVAKTEAVAPGHKALSQADDSSAKEPMPVEAQKPEAAVIETQPEAEESNTSEQITFAEEPSKKAQEIEASVSETKEQEKQTSSIDGTSAKDADLKQDNDNSDKDADTAKQPASPVVSNKTVDEPEPAAKSQAEVKPDSPPKTEVNQPAKEEPLAEKIEEPVEKLQASATTAPIEPALPVGKTTLPPDKPTVSKREELDQGLKKTKRGIFDRLSRAVAGKSTVDEDVLDDIEQALIQSDVGVDTTIKIIDRLEARVAKDKYLNVDELYAILKEEIVALLTENNTKDHSDFVIPDTKPYPYVMMVVGVNGVGKTTTIGKLAHHLKLKGHEVVLGAADTFRAAAVDQLQVWADRVGVSIVKQGMGSDPAAVAFDTVESAFAKKADVVMVDTAGRLHNKKGLMEELGKIKRVMQKVVPQVPHDVMLVLDGSTGQNALEQAKQFSKVTEVTCLAITKLDGTAKGGVVLGIADQLKVPIRYIGVGEKLEHLHVFNKADFVDSLFDR